MGGGEEWLLVSSFFFFRFLPFQPPGNSRTSLMLCDVEIEPEYVLAYQPVLTCRGLQVEPLRILSLGKEKTPKKPVTFKSYQK